MLLELNRKIIIKEKIVEKGCDLSSLSWHGAELCVCVSCADRGLQG